MFFRDIKKKDGFTLVEILIVVFIIGVLSTLAVGGYTEYRRSTLLDFSADSIIAQIYEMKDKTVHGDFGGERFEEIKSSIESEDRNSVVGVEDMGNAKCFGISFSGTGIEAGIKSLEKDYSGKKVWNSVKDDFDSVACGNVSSEGVLELDEMVSVDEIYAYKEFARGIFPLNDFSITFIPPDGKFEFGGGFPNDSKYVVVVIKYGISEEDRYKKKLVFDLQSGKVNSESY